VNKKDNSTTNPFTGIQCLLFVRHKLPAKVFFPPRHNLAYSVEMKLVR